MSSLKFDIWNALVAVFLIITLTNFCTTTESDGPQHENMSNALHDNKLNRCL